ncbi:hypothetical protein JXA48_03160 [Candidatus Woesearchaeota archaeon]|nr:hypothetical protein [Candidatus Woesearchaeota archaeon]
MTYFIQGSLSFANILLAVFVLFFAISFLRKTKENKDRNPWLFLLIAVVVFFCIQILKVLELMGHIHLDTYMFYLDSMFIAIVLFTFIFQYNLILSSELIQIKRKEDSKGSLKNLQSELKTVEKIGKKLKKEEKGILTRAQELEKFTKLAEKSASKIKSKPSKKKRK